MTTIKTKDTRSDLQASKLDSAEVLHRNFLIRNIGVLADILAKVYGSPDHGNKTTAIDELIYIHLSKKTNEHGYVQAYDRLQAAFPDWRGLADADPQTVRELIKAAGLGNQRTNELLANVRTIKKKFGAETLEPLHDWSEKKVYDFLVTLRGIGPKSALCIMMYALRRKVFPVDTHVQVVCERLGFLKSGLHHDEAQEVLANLFPKKLRYSLHVNMLAHGRKICKKTKPICGNCQLSKFCMYYRESFKGSTKGFALVDVFAGAGGASLGLMQAGFSPKLAIDNDQSALDTYYLNHIGVSFEELLCGDIRSFDDTTIREKVQESITLVFGGPPCQGWSHIGKNHKDSKNGSDFFNDPKNTLYKQFIRQLDIFKPEFFVMENVPGLTSAHSGKYVKIIQKEFELHGYQSLLLTLNAADFGIAQKRTRIFFIGRKASETSTEILEKIKLNIENKKTNELKSFRQAIINLPHLKPGEGANVTGAISNSIGVEGRFESTSLVFNHFSRSHNKRDLIIYRLLAEGEDYGKFSERNEDASLLPYASDSFKTKFRKINGNQPSPAIISHLSRDANSYIHPDDNRGITVREGARIQSFPDDFIFLGNGFRQFILLGNAVPPALAEIIGKSIIEVIKEGFV